MKSRPPYVRMLVLLSLAVISIVSGVSPEDGAHLLDNRQQSTSTPKPQPTGAVPSSGACVDSGSGGDAGNLCVKVSGAKLTKVKELAGAYADYANIGTATQWCVCLLHWKNFKAQVSALGGTADCSACSSAALTTAGFNGNAAQCGS